MLTLTLLVGLGQVIGIGVIKAMLGRTDEWAYRIPFGLQVRSYLLLDIIFQLTPHIFLQWMWPVPLFIGVWLAPESPWSVPASRIAGEMTYTLTHD